MRYARHLFTAVSLAFRDAILAMAASSLLVVIALATGSIAAGLLGAFLAVAIHSIASLAILTLGTSFAARAAVGIARAAREASHA